jgi:threonine synthase
MYEHAPLVRLPRIESYLRERFGINQPVFAKIELHTTSTFKDRAAEQQIIAAKNAGFREVTAATSGNFGESLAHFAKEHGLKCTLFIPQDALSSRAEFRLTEKCGAEVRPVRGNDYDVALKASNKYAETNPKIYNANPGVVSGTIDNRAIQVDANATIATEIADELKVMGFESIGLVACPAGNATLAASLPEGFRQRALNPRLLVGTCENPLVRAALRRWRECPDLERPIKVTYLTEAGAGTSALDGRFALEAVRGSGGAVVEVDAPSIEAGMNLIDEAIQEALGHSLRKPIRILPFAAAGLAGMIKQPAITERLIKGKRSPIDGPIVLVITGVQDGAD